MRNWMSVVLIAVAMAACHPRYAPLDEGGEDRASALS
jgi:hypothetical protein